MPVTPFSPRALLPPQVEHAALLGETAAAEARGVPVHFERATLALTEYFARVAVADNTTASQATLRQQYGAFYSKAPKGFADALAEALPVHEANDTVYVLHQARAALAVAAAAESRPPLPSRNLIDGGKICDGYGQLRRCFRDHLLRIHRPCTACRVVNVP